MSDKKNKAKDEAAESEEQQPHNKNKEESSEKGSGKGDGADGKSGDGNEKSGNKDDKPGDSQHDSEDESEGDSDVIKVARTSTSPALLSRLRHSREFREARGLGAGGTGAATFHLQRITALALIPLAIWFAVSMIRLSMGSRAAATDWLAWPVNAAIMALFIVISLRHAVIGVQIIFEDYIGNEGLRAVCVLVVKAIALVIGVAVVAALIHLAL